MMEENVPRTPVFAGVQKSIYPVAKPSQISALSRWTLTFRQRVSRVNEISLVALIATNLGTRDLHSVVIRAPATLRWNPGDDLVGILNVAGFAVNAVGGIQANAL